MPGEAVKKRTHKQANTQRTHKEHAKSEKTEKWKENKQRPK